MTRERFSSAQTEGDINGLQGDKRGGSEDSEKGSVRKSNILGDGFQSHIDIPFGEKDKSTCK